MSHQRHALAPNRATNRLISGLPVIRTQPGERSSRGLGRHAGCGLLVAQEPTYLEFPAVLAWQHFQLGAEDTPQMCVGGKSTSCCYINKRRRSLPHHLNGIFESQAQQVLMRRLVRCRAEHPQEMCSTISALSGQRIQSEICFEAVFHPLDNAPMGNRWERRNARVALVW